ncbi:Pseudouridine synthase I, TruA [Metarhizium album ARSEF 1941]|uniref:Pseudouridine synthase I, TruA n=1 Tax=Metarhizium album (strain ARSEF 1941) TaxID=1081103 RepID=A0A0B2X0K2_METAS|nr:Pseudouridine synthase I, TruA [Metarhizium album ARSEF 1941]KHN99192.1 Pseudouridine synthase I, TruA [Metarhizium album ARSEF 1941]
MAGETNYNNWTKSGLIQRLKELEVELEKRPQARKAGSAPETEPNHHASAVTMSDDMSGRAKKAKAPKEKRKMDPSRYSTRFIALKLAYLGKNYGGFEFQAMGNRPSIEEELWNALTRACLIFPEDERVVQFDCCDYSKCGRTDRGVSAFGQVVGLRVRSNRPLAKKKSINGNAAAAAAAAQDVPAVEAGPQRGRQAEAQGQPRQESEPFDDVRDELCYPRILNRLLPDDIRILAWCPSPPPHFSARFSCRERQYRYFFTQPAFAPDPASPHPSGAGRRVDAGWLDIGAMRDAAKRYEGEHDFRNFCKTDPAKQVTNFRRRIFESDIVEVQDASSALPYLQTRGSSPPGLPGPGPYPKAYYFHVRGSAFLWHQIRHMVAILFLVGQGLEPPSLVSELLDTAKHPGRPSYVMADEVPLVLWDCIFPDISKTDYAAADAPSTREDSMRWIHVGEEHPPDKFGQFGVMDSLWQAWRGHKMDELLSSQLLQLASRQGRGPTAADASASASARVFEGGDSGRLCGKYVPVMERPALQSPEEQSDRYAQRKGYADAQEMHAQKGAA